jgi:hypothetical protein
LKHYTKTSQMVLPSAANIVSSSSAHLFVAAAPEEPLQHSFLAQRCIHQRRLVGIFGGRMRQCKPMLIKKLFDHLDHLKHYTKTSQMVLPSAANIVSSSSARLFVAAAPEEPLHHSLLAQRCIHQRRLVGIFGGRMRQCKPMLIAQL